MLWERTLLPAAPSYIAAGASDTYTGDWIENDGASGSVQALKDSTQSGTLTLQGSNDGVTVVQTAVATTGTGRRSTVTLPATSKLYRVKYVNGVTAETGTALRFLLSSVALNEGEFVSMAVPGILGATAGSRFVGATAAGAPASGTFRVGDFIVDLTGAFYVCTVAGTPGTWVAVAASSGTFTGDVIARNGVAGQIKIGRFGPGSEAAIAFGNPTDAVIYDSGSSLITTSTLTAMLFAASGLTGSQSASRFVGATLSGAPVSGAHAVGDYTVDSTGTFYICTVAGTPGTWVEAGSASLTAGLALKAPLASPTFTGVVTAPILSASGNTGATAGGRFAGAVASGAPASGTYAVGDFTVDRTGSFWVCTVAGTPGTWVNVVAGGGGASLVPVTADVLASETTTSSSYTGLTTPLTVAPTVGASGKMLVFVASLIANSGANLSIATFALSGANTLASTQGNGCQITPNATGANQPIALNQWTALTGLAAGVTTVTAQYAVVGGTGSFGLRRLIAIPL